MIEFESIILIIVALAAGVLFFIADFFEHKHQTLHSSLIAGISITYFFLLVLPEISEGLPEYPLHLEIFKYLFVLIGFSFIHVSEKLILQKVEGKSQKRMRKLIKMERSLEIVEKNIEILISAEINQDNLDKDTLKHLVETLTSLNEQQDDIVAEINTYKKKIQDHIHKDLQELRFFTNFVYHFLVGIILVGLLFIELIPGILFFFFAWFRAVLSNRAEAQIIFTDLDIYDKPEREENLVKELISATSAILGVIIGLIFEFVLPVKIELELIYVLFSFISGVILYTIVREVIPEKEKGNPKLFVLGAIGFTILIFIIKISTSFLSV